MFIALLLFCGYLRFLYYILFEARNKIFIWRVALFLLSFLPLISSLYFLNLWDIISVIKKYKVSFQFYLIFVFSIFVYANWRLTKISKDTKKNDEIKKDLIILIIAVVIYCLLSI